MKEDGSAVFLQVSFAPFLLQHGQEPPDLAKLLWYSCGVAAVLLQVRVGLKERKSMTDSFFILPCLVLRELPEEYSCMSEVLDMSRSQCIHWFKLTPEWQSAGSCISVWEDLLRRYVGQSCQARIKCPDFDAGESKT